MEERLDTETEQERERDMWRLKDKVDDLLDFYYKFEDKHGGIPDWDVVEYILLFNVDWPRYPLEPIPEEEE